MLHVCYMLRLQGISNEQLTGPNSPLASFDLTERVQALNKLLASHKVTVFQQGTQLLYKTAAAQDARWVTGP